MWLGSSRVFRPGYIRIRAIIHLPNAINVLRNYKSQQFNILAACYADGSILSHIQIVPSQWKLMHRQTKWCAAIMQIVRKSINGTGVLERRVNVCIANRHTTSGVLSIFLSLLRSVYVCESGGPYFYTARQAFLRLRLRSEKCALRRSHRENAKPTRHARSIYI